MTYYLSLPEDNEQSGMELDIAALRVVVGQEILGFKLLLDSSEHLYGSNVRVQHLIEDEPDTIEQPPADGLSYHHP